MEPLDLGETRVLGALLEKEATTPEYYPLSLNALVNACNQKSNRDPIVDFDDETVLQALDALREKKLSLTITGSGRVVKYAQRISETLNLGRREVAVLCVLLLRGPQTLGELKDRTARMFSFTDLAEVESVLDKLAEWPAIPLAKKLERSPGQKEARYAQLLSGEPEINATPDSFTAAPLGTSTRIAQLEDDLARLRADFESLQARFDALEKQLS
jgi:uncharacterized protein